YLKGCPIRVIILKIESEDNFEFFEKQPLDFEVQTTLISNQNSVEIADVPVVERLFTSLDEIDQFLSLYTNKDNFEVPEEQSIDIEVQTTIISNQNSVEIAKQPLDVEVQITIISNQNSGKIVDTPVVGQTFSNWDEIDRFISLYAKSLNFVSVIRSSEYNNGVCQSHRYACKHQGYSETQQQSFIIGLGDNTNAEHVEQSFPDLTFCLPNISFNDIYTKINYRKSYMMINGLSKKAIQTRIDTSSGAIKELEDFMNKFITKH
ncbi:6604_t:CDS:2, partial [Dentiscutata erythropus]